MLVVRLRLSPGGHSRTRRRDQLPSCYDALHFPAKRYRLCLATLVWRQVAHTMAELTHDHAPLSLNSHHTRCAHAALLG